MIDRIEQYEKAERAKRLAQARVQSGLGGYRKLANLLGWNENTYKSHELRGGFGLADARKYAKAFKVSLNWLFMGTGDPADADDEAVKATDVPLISWISAGALGEHEGIMDLADFPTIPALDLPDGDWIALRVVGDSMNKISPPGSIVFVNRNDRRLAPNACYIVADEDGNATYKRYRPNDNPPFQPASYAEIEPPAFQGAVTVIGRVKRSIIEM